MILNIQKELLESFGLFEADNPDGTDNDGDEKVIPGDVQHGFKSKVMSKDIINPTLQEIEVNSSLVEPIMVDKNNVFSNITYRKNIDTNYINVSFYEDSNSNIWSLEFTVNDQFSSINNKEIMFQVYQFVFDCLYSFIQSYEPEVINFNGFNEKQDEMYGLFLKRLSKNITNLGYTISKNSLYYVLKRKEETLTEIDLSNQNIKPSEISGDTTYYKEKIDGNNVKVIIFNDGDLGVVDFEVNNSFNKEKDVERPFKIYDYVINCITSYLIEYNPERLMFTPSNNDQKAMYNLFTKVLNTKNTGYTLTKNSNAFIIQKDKSSLKELNVNISKIEPTYSDIGNIYKYETHIDDNEIKYTAHKETKTSWFISFTVNGEVSLNNIDNVNKSMFKIYQYILNCTYNFLKGEKPEKVIFYGAQDEQTKIYQSFIQQFNKELENLGYTVTKKDSDFILTKYDNDIDEMKRFAGL